MPNIPDCLGKHNSFNNNLCSSDNKEKQGVRMEKIGLGYITVVAMLLIFLNVGCNEESTTESDYSCHSCEPPNCDGTCPKGFVCREVTYIVEGDPNDLIQPPLDYECRCFMSQESIREQFRQS